MLIINKENRQRWEEIGLETLFAVEVVGWQRQPAQMCGFFRNRKAKQRGRQASNSPQIKSVTRQNVEKSGQQVPERSPALNKGAQDHGRQQ